MKKTLFYTLLALLFITPVHASAARPTDKGRPGGGSDGGSGSSTTLGIDISWPQCGKTLPADFAFAIVGVNDGTASTLNRCLVELLTKAKQASGTTDQPAIQLYVNTANPWDDIVEYKVTTWPIDNEDQQGNNTLDPENIKFKNPYGECVNNNGAFVNSAACSWQYGWERAIDDVHEFFVPAAISAGINSDPASYVWWLDVEIINSWQSTDANAYAYNKATLEGMTAYFEGVIGAKVGAYSTSYQWGVIVGDTVTNDPDSNLYGQDSWLAGARNEKDAKNRCKTSVGLTPTSSVSLVQFISKNLDYNVSC